MKDLEEIEESPELPIQIKDIWRCGANVGERSRKLLRWNGTPLVAPKLVESMMPRITIGDSFA